MAASKIDGWKKAGWKLTLKKANSPKRPSVSPEPRGLPRAAWSRCSDLLQQSTWAPEHREAAPKLRLVDILKIVLTQTTFRFSVEHRLPKARAVPSHVPRAELRRSQRVTDPAFVRFVPTRVVGSGRKGKREQDSMLDMVYTST